SSSRHAEARAQRASKGDGPGALAPHLSRRPTRGGTSGRGLRPAASPLRRLLDVAPITSDQSLLFCAAPTLDLPLNRNCICYPVEMLGPYQSDRASRIRIALVSPSLVFTDTLSQIVACRTADIVRVVCAQKHVNECAHICRRLACGVAEVEMGRPPGPASFE